MIIGRLQYMINLKKFLETMSTYFNDTHTLYYIYCAQEEYNYNHPEEYNIIDIGREAAKHCPLTVLNSCLYIEVERCACYNRYESVKL